MNHMLNPQEIHEAINAADNALDALRRADKNLSSAGGWGIWDMLGGGFFSTMFKHDHIDQARRDLEDARSAIQRFSRELADLDRSIDIELDVGSFLSFADYFTSSILADFLVQSKIRRARQQLAQAIAQVDSIRTQLWRMLG